MTTRTYQKLGHTYELTPGQHRAPYGAICHFCNARHGKSAHELEIRACVSCHTKGYDKPHLSHSGEVIFIRRRNLKAGK